VAQLDSRLPNASISHAKRRPLSLVNHARESVFVGKDKKEEDTKYRLESSSTSDVDLSKMKYFIQ